MLGIIVFMVFITAFLMVQAILKALVPQETVFTNV